MNKSIHEEFTRFFEKPTREALRLLLKNHFGEMNGLDFKMQWPEKQDIARHLLAMANSGGGCIIAGVSQRPDTSFDITGLSEIIDKTKFRNSIQKYISEKLQYDILDFAYSDSEYPVLIGKKFQVLIVDDTPQYIPFMAEAGGKTLEVGAIYVRHNTESTKASYEELQSLLNRRISTNYSSQNELLLEQHLKELKALYREASGSPHQHDILMQAGGLPEEYASWDDEYDSFVHQMIYKKRRIIEALIMGQKIEWEEDQSYYGDLLP